jgi:preprotein translocase subunit SecB
MTDQAKTKQSFELQKIYHKTSTFDAPNTPAVFLDEWKPSVKIDLKTNAERLSDSTYEVSLEVVCDVTATTGNQTLFTSTVVQAGIFEIDGYAEQELVALLGSYCPAQLYPFARSHIANLVIQGGFPHLLLAPVDFDALLEDAVSRAESEASKEENATTSSAENKD